MPRYYSFLNDRLAIKEIKKHKWIESEKNKQELGFATAALDWINKHGDKYVEYRLKSHLQNPGN